MSLLLEIWADWVLVYDRKVSMDQNVLNKTFFLNESSQNHPGKWNLNKHYVGDDVMKV